MFFFNINIVDVDEINVRASFDCSDRYFLSYSFRLKFNVKIIDMEDNKTKHKVFKYTSVGTILFLCRMRKKGYKVVKIKKLTLRYCGDIDDVNVCYRLKLELPFSLLEIAFYKNIATNDDYISNCCIPIQSVFTEKSINWYLYNKTSNQEKYGELWKEYFR